MAVRHEQGGGRLATRRSGDALATNIKRAQVKEKTTPPSEPGARAKGKIAEAAIGDHLEVLGDLVEKYENVHVEIPYVSDGATLLSLMDEKGVHQVDVVRGTGVNKTVLSLVLNGMRELSREQVAILSK